MDDEIIAKVEHLRSMRAQNTRTGMCIPGARAIAKSVGLDWDKFVREGIPATELEATGNAFCIALADQARKSTK